MQLRRFFHKSYAKKNLCGLRNSRHCSYQTARGISARVHFFGRQRKFPCFAAKGMDVAEGMEAGRSLATIYWHMSLGHFVQSRSPRHWQAKLLISLKS
ncbi:hypothetical protein EMIT053CA3_170002 [Pseudomonas donghuensis]